VVEEDVIKKTKDYEKPELAKTIAKTILVKTFVYAGSVKQRQLYPDGHEIVLSSFEPNMARALNLQPKDYLDALEWISGNLAYLLSEGGRYWFTQLASPIRRVEIIARTVDDHEAYKRVEEYAWKLLTKPYEEVVSGSRRRGRRETVISPFNISSSMVLTEPDPVDHDSADYILLAILSPIREDDAERMIYETASRSSRKYANTIYLIYPRDSDSLSRMISFAKYLIACEEVSKELGSLYADSEILDVIEEEA